MCIVIYSQVQTYAASSISGESAYLGNVLVGCGDEVMTTFLNATLPDNEEGMEALAGSNINMYLMSNNFLMYVVLLVCVAVLHLQGHTLEHMGRGDDDQPLYNIYGLFWGSVVLSAVGTGLLIVLKILIIDANISSAVPELQYMGQEVAAQLVTGAFFSLCAAIYFTCKLDFAIPSIFFWPCSLFTCILCCCCSTDHTKVAAKKLVHLFSLWSLVFFLILLFSHLSFVVLAVLAQPSTVISSMVMYIFFAAYVVQFMAILFTCFKQKGMFQLKARILIVIRKLLVSFLFASVIAVACGFGSLITAANAVAFYGSTRNSLYAVLSTCATPLFVTAFTWGIYKLFSLWLQFHTPKKEDRVKNKQPSNIALHIHMQSNEQTPLLEQPEAQMEEGMADTAS